MGRREKIRLLIVDDHPVVREGLKSILSHRREMEVVATACDGRSAVSEFILRKPDVTLMDLRMPETDGLNATQQIRKIDPKARVIILTTYDDEEDIFQAVQAGANAYLLKDVPREQLVECIRKVYDRKIVVPPRVAAKLASRISYPNFTPREVEVLRLMAVGRANKEIGAALGITHGTVKIHVNHILQKLGAKGRTEGARMAVEKGLVRLQ